MTNRARLLAAAFCCAAFSCAGARAQAQRPANAAPVPNETAAASASADPVVNELALLRKTLTTLSARLREISEKASAPESGGKMSPLAQNLDVLSKAEQRAEIMRRQLLEMAEKETVYRTRLMQLDDDMRPDSIDRSLSGMGTTRMQDLRELRRGQLLNERRGVEILLNQAAASRVRLEDDLKQADELVARIRRRLFPIIDRELDKLQP